MFAGQLINGGGLEAVTFAADELFVAFESVVAELTVAVSEIVVPSGTAQFTVATMVNVAVSPATIDGLLQVTVPLAPTAGVVQVQPAGALFDLNVVCGGKLSATVTLTAGAGPV